MVILVVTSAPLTELLMIFHGDQSKRIKTEMKDLSIESTEKMVDMKVVGGTIEHCLCRWRDDKVIYAPINSYFGYIQTECLVITRNCNWQAICIQTECL